MTCKKAQEFLESKRIDVSETEDARKARIGKDQALKLARQMDKVIAMKGKKVVEMDAKKASSDELLAVLLGPSGNLRAPAVKVKRTLLVGFSPEIYRHELLG